METRIEPFSPAGIAEAAGIIQAGGLVAFATETVYGLGGNACSQATVKSIFEVKGRPQDNPLIVHLDSPERIPEVCKGLTEKAEKLAAAFMPGPLTMVLKRKDCIAPAVSCGLETVAVRVPEHPGCRAFLAACKLPVAAPSANTSTRPSPTSARHVYDDLAGRIPLILEGGDCRVGIESTVVDMTREIPVILRPGIVTAEDISRVVGEVSEKAEEGGRVLSPGMKYRHYAPRCELLLVRKAEDLARLYRERQGDRPVVLCFERTLAALSGMETRSLGENSRQAANRFYRLLRECENDYGLILCECPELSGSGASLYNRMLKSAGQRLV